MKQLLRTLLLLALPLVVACNTDYNFDNISLEVTVGNTEGIVVPLGSTGAISLDSLLGSSELPTDAEGYYRFSMEEQMSHTLSLGTIEPITGLSPVIDPIIYSLTEGVTIEPTPFEGSKTVALPEAFTNNMVIPEGFPLLGQEYQLHDGPHTFEGELEVELPKEIAGIKQVKLGADGKGSIVNVKFDLSCMDDVTEAKRIDSLSIQCPAGFSLAKAEGEPINDYSTFVIGEDSTTPNIMIIEDLVMESGLLEFDVLVETVEQEAMVCQDGVMLISEDITYDLYFTGTLKAGTIAGNNPTLTVSSTLEVSEATLIVGTIGHNIEVSHALNQTIEVPAEIKEIHSIEVCDNTTGEVATLEIDLQIANCPLESLELRNVEITLPSYLQVGLSEGWSNTEGVITAPTIEITTKGWSESFSIFGVSTLDIIEGVVDLSAEVAIKAEVVLPEGSELTIDLDTALEDIVITPRVAISDLRIESVTGIVEPDLGSLLEPIEVSLGDFTSSLEGIELDLNISSPVLRLEVENPVGVGIDAVIQIDAYKGGEVAKSITTPTISILPSQTTSIIIAGEDSSVVYPDDASTLFYEVNGLADMIGLLPEKLVLTLDAETNKERPHTITLQDSYTFNVAYEVDAPLAFSDTRDGHIGYTTTIEDIDLSELADIDVVVESLVLDIDSESSLPIDLSLSLEMLDAEGNPIEGISATTTGLIEGTIGAAEAITSESSIAIAIEAPEDSTPFREVAKINKIRCTLEGTTLSGGALNKSQYIDLSLSLLLPDGVTIDLATLGGGSGKGEGEGEGAGDSGSAGEGATDGTVTE